MSYAHIAAKCCRTRGLEHDNGDYCVMLTCATHCRIPSLLPNQSTEFPSPRSSITGDDRQSGGFAQSAETTSGRSVGSTAPSQPTAHPEADRPPGGMDEEVRAKSASGTGGGGVIRDSGENGQRPQMSSSFKHLLSHQKPQTQIQPPRSSAPTLYGSGADAVGSLSQRIYDLAAAGAAAVGATVEGAAPSARPLGLPVRVYSARGATSDRTAAGSMSTAAGATGTSGMSIPSGSVGPGSNKLGQVRLVQQLQAHDGVVWAVALHQVGKWIDPTTWLRISPCLLLLQAICSL